MPVRYILFLLFLCGSLALLGCNDSARQTTITTHDSLAVGDTTVVTDTTEPPPHGEVPPPPGSIDTSHVSLPPPLRVGTHHFTLHWISWDKPGYATISPPADGWYPVSGSQRDKKGNFVTIEGKLQYVNPLELKFDGIILTKTATINKGDTCRREGEQTFLSTKGRKYWRLQKMYNCEGSGVVDYIDIYF